MTFRIMPRFALSGAALLILFFFLVVYSKSHALYVEIMNAMGVSVGPIPFLDWSSIPASIDCWARGIDVYVSNPCDYAARVHNYSPLWLRATFLPVSHAWIGPAGLLIATAFILSLAVLPSPRSKTEFCALLLGVLSSFTVLGLERANVDVIIFVGAILAAVLWLRSFPVRVFSYAILVLLGLLKFYPFVGLVLALRERPRACAAISGAATLTIGLFAWHYAPELARMFPNIPTGSYLSGGLFGARNLPFGAALLIRHGQETGMVHPGGALDQILTATGLAGGGGGALFELVLAIASALISVALATRGRFPALTDSLPERHGAFVLLGSALLVGCFFTGQSVVYRGMFFLLVLPGLFALANSAGHVGQRRIASATIAAIVALMWEPALNHQIAPAGHQAGDHGAAYIAIWLLRETTWWWVISVLDAVLISMILRSTFARTILPAIACWRLRPALIGADANPSATSASGSARTPS